MESLVRPIIEIVKFVGTPVVRYLKYHKKFNEYEKKFKCAKGDLRTRKQDIESRLETELVIGKVAKMEVQKWQRDVEEIIIQDFNKQGCLFRSCQAKDLDEKTQDLMEMYDKGGEISKAESLVIDDHSRKGVVLSAEKLHGRDGVKAKILKYLKEDEFTRIGICGIGGLGKTTIMKNVHNELVSLRGGRFKKIAFVTVSKKYDVVQLQKSIASQIQNGNFPDDMDAETRAGVLSEMLRGGSYLLILDDVWEPLPLVDIGIPDYDGDKGCKLVLTTRFRDVARRMDCKEVSLELFSKSEALQLFLSKVGNVVLSSRGEIKQELQRVLRQVVNECGGLPLAIVTVAATMRNETSPSVWEIALIELKDRKKNVASSRIVDGATEDAFEILKFSYDRLGDPGVQSCFLYCAMYPEDFEIPKGRLIEYWIAEGFIDEKKTRHEMRCKGHAILKQLEDNCLLENVETIYFKLYGDEDDEAVKMHDLLRNLALDIASKDHRFLGKAGMKMKKLPGREEWREDLQKVSLMMNSIEEVPRDLSSPKCETLTTLLLSGNKLVSIPESFFERMHQLRILDLSKNHEMESLPNSVSKLDNLTTLLLRSCRLLKMVPSLSSCVALTKLDLCKSGIEEVPEGMEMLTNLKNLDLNRTMIRKLPEGILLKFSHLQFLGLYIRGVEVKAEELGELKNLEFFSGYLRDLDELSYCTKLMIQSEGNWLREYSVAVGGSSNEVNVAVKRELIVSNLPVSTENHFQLPLNLESVVLYSCEDFKYLSQLCLLNKVVSLNKLVVSSSECLEFAFPCPASFFNFNPFQNLTALWLENLDNLVSPFEEEEEEEALASSAPAHSNFPLKTILFRNCPRIKKLFPPWLLLGCFQNLENIAVEDCEELEEIIIAPNLKTQVEEPAVNHHLPKLKLLRLSDLPKLKSICGTNTALVCDSLEELTIDDCTMLTRIPLYLPQLDNNSQPSPPHSLKTIQVYPAEWWESLEWDHPNAAQVLSSLVEFG